MTSVFRQLYSERIAPSQLRCSFFSVGTRTVISASESYLPDATEAIRLIQRISSVG